MVQSIDMKRVMLCVKNIKMMWANLGGHLSPFLLTNGDHVTLGGQSCDQLSLYTFKDQVE